MLSIKKKPFYKESSLRFQCTGCGKCCYGTPGYHYIKLNRNEMEKIRIHLGVSPDWFRRRYIETLEHGDLGIRLNTTGVCPFLDNDGRCSIYQHRPAQCRTYPFWPEIVDTERNWKDEARRCEGINRGQVIPLKEIEKRLKDLED
ncbi:MAG: YkgJ family cysteine cluster protein [Acidiferrobacterales bacterium]|jgi:Fe-S-cluster containining protein|nr:YkgJ family cysteine cluster protein [Acidiferrobacterales bacterium]